MSLPPIEPLEMRRLLSTAPLAISTVKATSNAVSSSPAISAQNTPAITVFTPGPAGPVTSSGQGTSVSVSYYDSVPVKASSLSPNNLVITGPQSITASLLLPPTTDSTTLTLFYWFDPPAGGWTSAYNGTYTVSLASNSVSDEAGNYAAGQSLGTFSILVPPSPPDIYTSQANDESGNFSFTGVAGATSYNIYRSLTSGGEGSTPYKTGITQTFFSETGLTDGLDYYYEVTAVGPWGETAKSDEALLNPEVGAAYTPRFDSVTPGNGQATLSWTQDLGVTDSYNIYRSTTPGGEGSTPYKTGITGTSYVDTGLTNGTTYYYEIQSVRAGRTSAITRELGVRPVGPNTPIYGQVNGQQAAAAASYNLTQLGTSDWAHWADEGNLFYDDRKSTGGGQISNVSLYGIPFPDTASDPSRDSNWTDGTNTPVQPDSSTYLTSQGFDDGGFTFTVPADTTTRTLYVYAGGDDASTILRAHLSDASAADYVATATGSGIFTDFYTISYKAASAGQTLTLLLVKSADLSSTTGSADLIAAALAPGVPTTSAPVITTNPSSEVVTPGATATFTATAGGAPAPTVQWMVEPAGSSAFAAIPGATSTTLTVPSVTLAQSGNQYEAVFTNGIGSPATTTAATLTVSMTAPSASITGVQSIAAPPYNLTTLGTSDWAHWGINGNASAFDHKATGGSLISNVSAVGGGSHGAYTDSTRSVCWSDGTPLATDTGDDGYLWANNAIGAGYSFTVPASTAAQTLYVYLGGYSTGSTLTAHLSGGSAPDFVDNFSSSSHFSDLVAIAYNAASAGQTLTLTYVKSSNINGAGGSADLIAAWLVGAPTTGSAPVVTLNPSNLTVTGGGFASFSAAATGNPTPTVQWMVEPAGSSSFSAISGATSTTLTLGAATLSQSGSQYEAVFSNGVGSPATTTAATLTVNAANSAPVIVRNPMSQTVNPGSTVSFSAAASGSPSPTVQWQYNAAARDPFVSDWINITGATSPTLSFTANYADSGYEYQAVFSNGVGQAATTTAATLTVNAAPGAPVITLNPASQTLTAGQDASFTAAATGSPSPTVQWMFEPFQANNFSALPGQTAAKLDLGPATLADRGFYEAVFSNGVDLPATTTPAALYVNLAPQAPIVIANPLSQTIVVSNDVKFSAAATGNPSPTVQWMVETAGATSFSAISGATSTTLDLGGATLAQNGNEYEAVFSNGVGTSATTTAALLTVNPAPSGGSLSGVASNPANSYNLTSVGSSDWAHWGTGVNASAFDDRATGGSQISNVTRVGSGSYGAWSDPSRTFSWTDGTPLATDAGDDGYLWANTALGAGYSFSVPASTTTQTLDIFLGGFSSGGTLTAHLSDGSAPDYGASISGSALYNDLVTITYHAASAGQKLTLTWVKSSNFNGTGGSVDLASAWLVGTPVSTPPAVTTNPSSQTLTVGQDAKFSAAATGVPSPTVQWMVEPAGGSSFSAISGATSATLDLGAATLAQSGNKYEAVFSNGIGLPATTTAATLTVTPPASGSLSGVSSVAASSYNLTTLGTSDWAHWGVSGNPTAVDHKSTVGSQISSITRVGSGSFGGYTNPARAVSWTDGTPLASDTGDDGYLWANTGIGAGYSFTVPAGTTKHTVYVYLGGYSSGSTLTAHLSDGSASDYSVNLYSSGTYTNLIAITYNAASAGQTLKITYAKSQNINGTGGSADLMAAWLQ